MGSTDKTLAVVSQSGESLSFFNIDTGERVDHLEGLLPEPHELCYDERTKLLYISHAYKHGWYPDHGADCTEISIIDCNTHKVTDVIDISPYGGPHDLVLDKTRNTLYSSVEAGMPGDGGIIGIDLSTHKIVKAVASGHKSHWFAMTPDGRKAYTCNKEAGYVSVIDLVEEKMLGTIEMEGGTEHPAMSKDGRFAYFPCPTVGVGMRRSGKQGDFYIAVIDTEKNQTVRRIPLEFGAVTIHVDSQDRLIIGMYRYGPAENGKMPKGLDGRLAVLGGSEEDFRVLDTFPTDLVPLTVFSSPDGKRAFAANIFSGTVTVVDLQKRVVERTLDVDLVKREDKNMFQGAHGLALVP